MNDITKTLLREFLIKAGKDGIKEGLSQEEHTAFLVTVICETVYTDATPTDRQKLFTELYPLVNGSALRQKAEKLWPLPADGKATPTAFMKVSNVKKGADATALANKWFTA